MVHFWYHKRGIDDAYPEVSEKRDGNPKPTKDDTHANLDMLSASHSFSDNITGYDHHFASFDIPWIFLSSIPSSFLSVDAFRRQT